MTTRKHIDTAHAHNFAYTHTYIYINMHTIHITHMYTHTRQTCLEPSRVARVVIAKLEPHTHKVQEEQMMIIIIKKKRTQEQIKKKRRGMDEFGRPAHPAVLDLAEAD